MLKCAWGRGLNSCWLKQRIQIFLAFSSLYWGIFDWPPWLRQLKAFHKHKAAASDGLHRVTAYLHISSQNLYLLMLGRGGYLGMRRCPERSATPARRCPFELEVLGSLAMPCSPSRGGLCVAGSPAKQVSFPALMTAWGSGLSHEFKIS